MCYRPLHIWNNKRCFCEGIDKVTMSVPCGHCADCQRQQQNDWYQRIYAEYLDFHVNGCIAFPTLTYREDNVPFYIDEENHFKCYCFNKEHVKMFIKKLRVYMSRSGLPSNGIKYLICSEYGKDERFTKRPHYHALIFFPFKIDYLTCLNLFRKAWVHGNVGVSKVHGLFIHHLKGCKYASKYITKDLDFFDTRNLDKSNVGDWSLNDYLHVQTGYDIKTNCMDDPKSRYERFRPYKQFHLQSIHFGYSLFERYGLTDISDDELCKLLAINKFVPPHESSAFALPKYFYRLLTKKVDSNGIWQDTKVGKLLHNILFYRNLKKSIEDFQSIMSNFNKFCYYDSTEQEFAKVCKSKLDNCSISLLMRYRMSFQDVQKNLDKNLFIQYPDSYDFIFDNAFKLYVSQHSNLVRASDKSVVPFDETIQHSHRFEFVYGNQDYNELSDCFDFLSYLWSRMKEKAFLEKKRKNQELRDKNIKTNVVTFRSYA